MSYRPTNPFDGTAPTEPTKAQREAMKRKPAELDALLDDLARTPAKRSASARASWDQVAADLNGSRETIRR